MDCKLIISTDNKNIYYLKDDKISFYVSIPTNVENSALSIVINVLDNNNGINPSVSDMDNIKKEISNYYSSYNNSDVAIVMPIIDSNVLEQLKLGNDENIYNYTDRLFSYLINVSYKYLASNGIAVNKIVKLNNNLSYKMFIEWFVTKYSGRVELVNYNNSVVNDRGNTLVQDVSKDDEALKIANNVLENTNTFSPIEDTDKISNVETHEPGFVSYVLLGVVVVVISLIMLYKLL